MATWLPNRSKREWQVLTSTGDASHIRHLQTEQTESKTNNFGAQVFGINKDTKLAKEAFDLITFLTKGEYDQKLADETVGIPADTTNTEWPAMVECAKPVIEQSTNRFTWACGVESNVDMTPVIKENFIKLMAGSITADEFVSSMQDAAK